MRILLVYPRYPDTFWSFRHILGIISKRAGFPPLGLLTVAAMLPPKWEKRLVDMNVSPLRDEDLRWADYVFVSAMVVQKASAQEVIRRANKVGVKVVAGGPLFTTGYGEFEGVDHFVLNEAEATLPPFLRDLADGCARHIYTSAEWPDVTKTPVPLWQLLDMKKYATMSVQYCRGCPFDCEFCDIAFLNGRRPRTKDADQFIEELEAIYGQGWRGGVFVVDDNFIGNRRKLKAELLPAVIRWSQARGYPFSFNTEASVNLADDEELMELMVRAGFNTVFVGIETPDEESLAECGKVQNRRRDLVACVKKIQNHGLQVQGGFIVGFDSDTPSIFDRQIEFIQRSGIVTAMVGLLNAPRGTRLYERLKREGRLLKDVTGDNTDLSLNFVPKMEWSTLIEGYRRILDTIYSPKLFYERIRTFLREYRPPQRKRPLLRLREVWPLLRALWALGVKEKGR
ncbi:MAG: B12-binding domain-containing radical SAM protein, partial [bacterium]